MQIFLILSALILLTTNANSAVVIKPTVLNTVEDAAFANYSVVLDAPPLAGETVTITPTSSDLTEGTTGGAVVFDINNWDTQLIMVVTPGGSGDGNDGNVAYNITHTVTSSQPAGVYDGAVAANVGVTNHNVEGVAGINIWPSSGIFIVEGTTAVVIMRLS
ncbi:MAG: hypothetical protein KZQ81_13385 [Candidatus Thiodiazotropha sp. (ex Rostrolucina anterorostrata)]|nr:hypothetical protein [Candidatus Thiodiazotropha sp. (ex Rostrolucina anterorostrata)]